MMPRPIFIVGSGRSGTSILTWAIGQHPNIITVPETDWKTALASWSDGLYQIGMAQAPSGHFDRWRVTREAFLEYLGTAIDIVIKGSFEARFPDRRRSLADAAAQRYLLWFHTVNDPKDRWVDGTPSSTGYSNILATMFPESRFINLARNPDSVVKSWMGASFRSADLAKAEDLVAHIYHSQRAGYLVHSAYGDRSIRVIFEKLTADPESTIRTILEFIGEDYSPHCIKPLAEKINSSGEPNEKILSEFRTIEYLPTMEAMRQWYDAAKEPSWRIEKDPETARAALAEYAKYMVPLSN